MHRKEVIVPIGVLLVVLAVWEATTRLAGVPTYVFRLHPVWLRPFLTPGTDCSSTQSSLLMSQSPGC